MGRGHGNRTRLASASATAASGGLVSILHQPRGQQRPATVPASPYPTAASLRRAVYEQHPNVWSSQAACARLWDARSNAMAMMCELLAISELDEYTMREDEALPLVLVERPPIPETAQDHSYGLFYRKTEVAAFGMPHCSVARAKTGTPIPWRDARGETEWISWEQARARLLARLALHGVRTAP